MSTEVRIEKLVYGGSGLARIEGEVALVDYVLPGELVRLGEKNKRGGVLRSRAGEIVEPSSERVQPRCPYFGRCGGCQYQHAGYAYQLAQKVAILREQFTRVGKIEAPADIGVVAGPEYEYRNRVQLHIHNRELGYREANSHNLVAITHCPISSPRINEAIKVLRRMLHDSRWPRFVRSIELFTNEQDLQLNVTDSLQPVAKRFFDWAHDELHTADEQAITYRAGEFAYRVGRRSFFQVNRFLIDKLIEATIADVQGTRALDLYAGVGLFSLPLARVFSEVIAVESGQSAIADLNENARLAGVQVTAVQAQTETFLSAYHGEVDLAVVDPPRTGLGKSATAELLRIRPKRLAIVSCDPATLARDLAVLLHGGYRVHSMSLVDLFPQTAHLETLVHLTCDGS